MDNVDFTQLAIDTAGGEARVFSESIAGHNIHYRLLNTKEDLHTEILAKEWEGTVAYDSALATAIFALSVISIDGIPFYTPITPDFKQTASDRWEKALDYYRSFITLWYENYLEHSIEQAQAFDSLKKK